MLLLLSLAAFVHDVIFLLLQIPILVHYVARRNHHSPGETATVEADDDIHPPAWLGALEKVSLKFTFYVPLHFISCESCSLFDSLPLIYYLLSRRSSSTPWRCRT